MSVLPSTTGLERYHFIHEALPELDLGEVDTSLTLFGKKLAAPILISSMTGGTEEAGEINQRLAEAAQECGVAMGVGSQRAALEHPEQIPTFAITRKVAPDILLFANLGAVQLNYGYGIDECRRAVDMLSADALILHLNPLQEAVQVGGDTNFAGLAKKIEEICKKLDQPVIVKEVGWGISERTAKLLADCGVAAIDVAGAGGTSWSQVEMYRAPDEFTRQLAATFVGWGIPTAESIMNVRNARPEMTIFRQRWSERWPGYRQMHRPWRHPGRHGRTVPESCCCFYRKSRGNDQIDSVAAPGHHVCHRCRPS